MSTTPHGQRTYLPAEHRSGRALCLSGGGFRAALFHLGAVRRLHEVGTLDTVTTIASVSGGSQLSAHLAKTHRMWHRRPLSAEDWERDIALPFRDYTARNLSTAPVIKGLLLPKTNAGVDALAARVRERLVDLKLRALPVEPRFRFCATDLVAGRDWIFDREMDGDWDVATAVAVSSCHPIFLRPYTKRTPQYIALVDGGVDDDRGLEPVWRTHETLLVSDGGDTIQPEWGKSLFWSLARSASVLWNQSQVVQKRWLMSNFAAGLLHGTYWSIAGSPWHYREHEYVQSPPRAGYSPALARDVIAPIRTDYDAFSTAEAAVLENHGYLMADAAIQAHVIKAESPAPLQIPHPAWMGERKVRAALSGSARKLLFGHLRPEPRSGASA
jgi:NTE family protein